VPPSPYPAFIEAAVAVGAHEISCNEEEEGYECRAESGVGGSGVSSKEGGDFVRQEGGG
jgi:hypothetical protein